MVTSLLRLLLVLSLLTGCAQIKKKNAFHFGTTGTSTAYSEDNDGAATEAVGDSSEYVQDSHLVKYDVNPAHIERWIKFYTQRRGEKERYVGHLKNAYRYQKIVVTILEELGLPPELYYLGLIESGYNLKIKSRAKATGPWQFMSGTAVRYNLRINNGLDERQSLIKSTYAAGHYLKDLYNIFSSWELALAAYNAGEYKILNSIRNAKTRDFSFLIERRMIPQETQEYIPKLLAARYIANNLEEFGFQSDVLSGEQLEMPKAYPLTVNVAVEDVISALQINRDLFNEYNSDLKGKYIAASSHQPHILYLPEAELSKLTAAFENKSIKVLTKLPSQHTKKHIVHIVRKGDTWSSLARNYSVKLSALTRYNKRSTKSLLRLKQRIKIPLVDIAYNDDDNDSSLQTHGRKSKRSKSKSSFKKDRTSTKRS